MYTEALFTTAQMQKQCPSTKEWINKMWSSHMVEYYLAIKKNEVLTQATTWMNPENMMLSERSQTQKATYCMIPFV